MEITIIFRTFALLFEKSLMANNYHNNSNNNQQRPRTQNVLEALFTNAVNSLEGRSVSGFKIQFDLNTGEVQVYDDRETLLAKNVIFDWANRPVKDLSQCKQQTNSIRVALIELKRKNFFDNPLIAYPFTVSLTDENFMEIEKIFMLGDSEYIPEGRLMKNLEQELQNFYKKLLEDIE
ncbi:MAG: hypothetical protein LBE91_02360 [Tannerella sp.]|nr:hypothetical protein [Tannerella sp.]